jgi:hypothetical protein
MMKSKTKLAKAITRSPLGTAFNDIIYLVLDEIECNRRHGLLSFCLVSRQFYIIGIPYLYRNIDPDLAKRSLSYD